MKDRQAEQEVLQKLAMPGLSRDAIMLFAIRLIELRFPDWKIKLTGSEEVQLDRGADGSHIMYFHNMLAECKQDPYEQASIVDRYVRVIAPPVANNRINTLENLVALVRDDEYLGVVDESVSLAARHYVADLWLVLARNDEESVTSLNRENALALGNDLEELIERGIKNVDVLLRGLSAERREHCYVLSAETIFFASTSMALGYVWDQLGELVEGDVVLGVPASDTVLFCGSEEPEALAQLRKEVAYVMRNGHHLVTENLFRRLDGEWRVFS